MFFCKVSAISFICSLHTVRLLRLAGQSLIFACREGIHFLKKKLFRIMAIPNL